MVFVYSPSYDLLTDLLAKEYLLGQRCVECSRLWSLRTHCPLPLLLVLYRFDVKPLNKRSHREAERRIDKKRTINRFIFDFILSIKTSA